MPTKSKAKNTEKEVQPIMATTPKKKVNFRDAVKPEYDLLEPQIIDPCKFIKYKYGVSGQGNDKVTLEFRREDGEGKQHFWKDFLTDEDYIWRLREALEVLDCDPDILNDPDVELEDAIKSVMGNNCALDIGIGDPYENKQGKIVQNNTVNAVMRS